MATLYLTPFGKDDPRLEHALSKVEPRIHFALNCGAKSCPPIKTFTSAFMVHAKDTNLSLLKLGSKSCMYALQMVDFEVNTQSAVEVGMHHFRRSKRGIRYKQLLLVGRPNKRLPLSLSPLSGNPRRIAESASVCFILPTTTSLCLVLH